MQSTSSLAMLFFAFCICNCPQFWVTAEEDVQRVGKNIDMFLERRRPTAAPKSEEIQPENSRDARLWRDSKSEFYYSNKDGRNPGWHNDNRRMDDSFQRSFGDAQVGFSSVRASRDAQLGRLGRVKFDNTITNYNRGWDTRDSMFTCHVPGLYFFAVSARGRVMASDPFVDLPGVVDVGARFRAYSYNFRAREADREACMDWKAALMLNGEPVVAIGGLNNTSSSNSIILPLNKNDRVWLELVLGCLVEIDYDGGYSSKGSSGGLATFSGHKIGEMGSSTAVDVGMSGINNIDAPPTIISTRRNYYPERRREATLLSDDPIFDPYWHRYK